MNDQQRGEILTEEELDKLLGDTQLDRSKWEFRHKIPSGLYVSYTGDSLEEARAVLKNARAMGLPVTITLPDEFAKYHMHMFKCMACSLHFTVFSFYADWPNEGTTREQKLGEGTGLVHCPECGGTGSKIHWHDVREGFIFEAVPGTTNEILAIR